MWFPMSNKSPTPDPRRVPWRPWRSAVVGWVVAGVALLAGVPIFLCMPPWVDVTHYDMCVRVVLHGGVYYRDVFDTNLPGIAWAMAAVRVCFGQSYEALRAVDLLVIAAEVWLLAGWVRRAGGTAASVAWLAAAVALWYPFTSEFNHIQRDPWMLLPALIAARLRLRRVEHTDTPSSAALIEGFIWGAAVWLKPHVVFPAFALWVVSAVLIGRREPRRRILRDVLGLLGGGVLAAMPGIAWLISTGAWPHFLDVFLNWNPAYMSGVIDGAGSRFLEVAEFFRSWGLLEFLAIPLACLALWEARVWSRQSGEPRPVLRKAWVYARAETEATANARLLLAALFLGWLAQGVIFQKGFDYVYIPIMLLGMAVIAAHGWAFGFVYLVWFAFTGALLNFTNIVPPDMDPPPGIPGVRLEHWPITDPKVMRLWPRCWREGSSPELRDGTGQYIEVFCGTHWESLGEVAEFLKTIQPALGPGELNCWHDGTHPLYLMLDLDPATRYMHYSTAFGITTSDDWVKQRVAEEVRVSRQRFVVADLARMTGSKTLPTAIGAGGDPSVLPAWFPASQMGKFPWNQRLAFRSGRYIVYEIVNPLGEIDLPPWPSVNDLGPGWWKPPPSHFFAPGTGRGANRP